MSSHQDISCLAPAGRRRAQGSDAGSSQDERDTPSAQCPFLPPTPLDALRSKAVEYRSRLRAACSESESSQIQNLN